MPDKIFQNTREFAKDLDKVDPLKEFRARFFIPQHNGEDCVYLIGNSLGLQPRTTHQYIQQELNDWATLGVEGHFKAKNPWMPYHEIFPAQLSAIVGCLPSEVIVMNQLTVNLHLLMVSFYRPTKQRFHILCEAGAFPSDQYALESQARFHGFNPEEAVVEIHPRKGEYTLRTEDILAKIDEYRDSIALSLFGGVNYYTGQFYDMQAITAAAQRAGAYAGFDLAHGAGNVELKLHEWNVDCACWCSYKYLNSGPGGVGAAFIHERHFGNEELPRFAGWWGHDKHTRFLMQKGFKPMRTAEGWQVSNAPILSMAAHKASLDIFTEAGMERLHQKRELLSGYLHFIISEINKTVGGNPITIITPSNAKERGCQLSIVMKEKGKEVFAALSDAGVFADWREPNVIRVATVPLYNSFEDAWRFGNIIAGILNKK